MIVMSSIHPKLVNGYVPGQNPTTTLALGETKVMTLTLSDQYGNAMPFGTKVTLNTTGISNAVVGTSFPTTGVASQVGPTTFSITMKASETAPAKGTFFINITAPSGSSELTTITEGTTIN